jgi:hypothetical protein
MSVLNVLTSLTDTLIRSEVRAAADRSALERGCVQAVKELGYSVSEVSAASGLTTEHIRGLLDQPVPLDDAALLDGIA